MIEYGDDPYSVWPPETPEMLPLAQMARGGWRVQWSSSGDDPNLPVAFELEKGCGVVPAIDGFESGLEFWEGSGFEVSSERSYNGSYSLHTGNRSNIHEILEPVYSFHPVIRDSLRFKCWYSLPVGHNFFIEVSDDGGERWLPLPGDRTLPGEETKSFQGLLTGESNGWADIKMSLGNYVGDEMLLRFRCSTISTEPTGGIYIDDFGPMITFRERHVEAQSGEPGSLLSWYRRLIWTRKSRPALYAGSYRAMDEVPEGVFAYMRERDGERAAVFLNFKSRAVSMGALPEAMRGGTWRTLLSTHRQEGEGWDAPEARLEPDEALILEDT